MSRIIIDPAQILGAVPGSHGNIAEISRRVGCTAVSIYAAMKRDPEVHAAIAEARAAHAFSAPYVYPAQMTTSGTLRCQNGNGYAVIQDACPWINDCRWRVARLFPVACEAVTDFDLDLLSAHGWQPDALAEIFTREKPG